jgi:hypothetical protein
MSAPIQWQKSSFSGAEGENCVEIALHASGIIMRESDDPSAAVLSTSSAGLRTLIGHIRASNPTN